MYSFVESKKSQTSSDYQEENIKLFINFHRKIKNKEIKNYLLNKNPNINGLTTPRIFDRIRGIATLG